MSRSLTFTGTGTLRTWTEPSGLAVQIKNEMISHGWSVDDVQITNALSTNQKLLSIAAIPAALVPTWNYDLSITVNTIDDADVQPVLNDVTAWFQNWFSDVAMKLSHDSLHPYSTFLRNYGLYLALGLGGLVVVRSLMRPAIRYAPTAGRYARRYGKYLLV